MLRNRLKHLATVRIRNKMSEYEGNFSNSVGYLYFVAERLMPLEGYPRPIIPRSCNYVSLSSTFGLYSFHK